MWVFTFGIGLLPLFEIWGQIGKKNGFELGQIYLELNKKKLVKVKVILLRGDDIGLGLPSMGRS